MKTLIKATPSKVDVSYEVATRTSGWTTYHYTGTNKQTARKHFNRLRDEGATGLTFVEHRLIMYDITLGSC